MRAMILKAAKEKLCPESVPIPRPSPQQVLVKVEATSK